MLNGTLSEEIEVKATADEAWKVFGSIKLDEILVEKVPHIFQKAEILEGTGGVGTVVKITFVPGKPGPPYHIEKFMVVDDEKRLKIVEIIEGGHLALGFTKYRILIQVLEKDENTCITKATVEYEIGEVKSDKVCLASAKPFVVLFNAVVDIFTKPKEA